MELLPEYDEEQTAQAVADFFLNDDPDHPHNYQRIKTQYMALRSISSPTGDITGVHGSLSNRTEEKWINGVIYKQALACIDHAISSCPLQSRIIMKHRFIDGELQWQVKKEAKIGGNDQYPMAEKRACREFADIMQKYRVVYGVEELIPDMLVTGN
ncbi:transcriptional regulator [Lacfervirus LFP01]|uniref:Transcriptional regulator n=1 Tax=Lactobacillus phage LFP01 TaxID=3051505 RepID=A0AAX3XGY4_9CAUD